MNISISQEQGRVPVSVIQLEGKLDSNSFQKLINEARALFDGGARHLLLDMTKLTYISSAGIVALHSIAKLFRGESLPNADAGWNTIRSLEKERVGGAQQCVKFLNVPPEVKSVLDVVGLAASFEMHTDLAEAVASF